ncbi:MAG: SDR family NAD(P)-dependent oxidoreductase, partial [Solirubrobacteraceae bacterium]
MEANQFNGPSTGTRLKDRVVLVTGGGTGIGRASADACAAQGALVAVAGRRPEPLEEAVVAIHDRGGRAIAITGDVGVADDAARMVRDTLREFT